MNALDPERVSGYRCPVSDLGGCFDEMGYEIDHILEVNENGLNDLENLQALCYCCHRVKTNRYNHEKNKKKEKVEEEGDEEILEILQDQMQTIQNEIEELVNEEKKEKKFLIFKELEGVVEGMRIVIRDDIQNTMIAEGTICLEKNMILHNGEEMSANQFAIKYNKKKVWRDLRVVKDGNYIRLRDLRPTGISNRH